MKNLLIFYFLLFSTYLIAQNSAIVFDHKDYSNSEPDYAELYTVSMSQLIPVERTLKRKPEDLLLLKESDHMDPFDSEVFSSLLLKEQLNKLNLSTPFKVQHNATLERFIRVYLRDRKEYFGRLINKSDYYFPIFEQYLDRYDLPLELKYLAVVESALNPVAISPSGAKGLWQFMYGTGLEYNLHIDSYVDERFDLMKSTQAACAYLNKLYQSFGNWDLALAAYNSGPGNVRKAIKRAGGNTNYWEIRQYLPRETSSYVPAFYATMYLFTHSEFHALTPLKGDVSYFETDTIQIKKSLTFEAIKKNTGIDLNVLRSFNPVYKKDLIPELKERRMTLTLPVNLMTRFIASEAELYNEVSKTEDYDKTSKVIPITLFNSYLVSTGDNLSSIARKHHISLEQLKIWNGLETNFLISGQRLVITDRKNYNINKKIKSVDRIETTESETTNGFTNYTVKYGDTLFKISKKFGNIPISELRAMNELDNVNYLKPGTKLKVKKRNSEI